MEHNHIGCGALVFCKETKRYLFLLRNQKKHSGSWGLVGGGVNSNEQVVEALKREIYEEIGHILINKIIPLEKFTSENNNFEYHTFVVTVNNEFVPNLNEEHRGYAWTAIEDHPKPLHPGVWRTFNFAVILEKIKTIESVLDITL